MVYSNLFTPEFTIFIKEKYNVEGMLRLPFGSLEKEVGHCLRFNRVSDYLGHFYCNFHIHQCNFKTRYASIYLVLKFYLQLPFIGNFYTLQAISALSILQIRQYREKSLNQFTPKRSLYQFYELMITQIVVSLILFRL